MNLKDLIMTEGHYVSLKEIHDGDAVYTISRFTTIMGQEDLLEFRVPKEDLRGGLFKREDKPTYFMRWIRKELERQEEQRKLVEQAKIDWDEGKQY